MQKFYRWVEANFALVLGLVLILKLSLSFFTPITSDEAYFWQWGERLSWTYYDHPFFTGLFVWLGQLLGSHIFFPRLISNIVQILIGCSIFKICLSSGLTEFKSKLLSLLYFCSPAYFLFFVITTDSPLFLFSFFAVVAFVRGYTKESPLWFLLSGVFIGLALLSKYLIIFIALSLLVSLFFHKEKKKIPLFLLSIGLGLLPFFLFNFYIAQQNCWWPLQFNVFNRAQGKEATFLGLLPFFVQQLFLIGPWLVYLAIKNRSTLSFQNKETNLYLRVYLVGLLLVGFVSLFATGLHWGLSLYSFAILGFAIFEEKQLVKILSYSFLSCVFFGFCLHLILAIAPQVMKGKKYYGDYVMGTVGYKLHQSLWDRAGEGADKTIYGTLGYTTSGIMQYQSGRSYIVFNDYDTNGRNDDLWTNYKDLDGRDFLIVSTYSFREYERSDYAEYFDKIEYFELSVEGATFYAFKGTGFKYQNYHDKYLTRVNKDFYSFKSYLPQGQCFFKEKYF